MNSFAIFQIAQQGMDRQQNILLSLASQMSSAPLSNDNKLSGKGFSHHIENLSQQGETTAPSEDSTATPSYLTTVTDMMEAMRLYRMNASVASAARSMIEHSLQISGK